MGWSLLALRCNRLHRQSLGRCEAGLKALFVWWQPRRISANHIAKCGCKSRGAFLANLETLRSLAFLPKNILPPLCIQAYDPLDSFLG